MESTELKDIALLAIGVCASLVPWILDKLNLILPKWAYQLSLYVSIGCIWWGLARLDWLSKIPVFQQRNISLAQCFLGVFAISLIFLLSNKMARVADETRGTTALQPSSAVIGPTAKSVEEFYRTYDNVLLLECENEVRAQAEDYEAGLARERFIIRRYASDIISAFFDYVWIQIFRSQLWAMDAVNKCPLTIEALRPFYEDSVLAAPSFYENYPFTSWLAFMKTNALVREDGDMISITVRGREFLKWMAHTGKSSNDRRN